MMTKVFWLFAGVEAVILLFMVSMALTDTENGGGSGGKEMAWAFFIILPGVLLGIAIALFSFTSSAVPRSIALAMVVAPLVIVIGRKADSIRRGRDYDAVTNGSAYFDDPKIRAITVAIHAGDPAKVAALLPGADVNKQGRHEMTLIAFALRQYGDNIRPICELLLNAGADPNHPVAEGDPAYFGAVPGTDPELLDLFLNHGANPNLAIKRAAHLRFWEPVLKMLDHGADPEPIRAIAEKYSHEDAIQGPFAEVLERLKKR